MFRVINGVKGLDVRRNASITLWILRATGHYPFKNEAKPRLVNLIWYFFVYAGVLLGEFIKSITESGNINTLSDGFFILLAHMAMLYKSFNTYTKQSKIRGIIEDLATCELLKPRNDRQRMILNESARLTGILVTFSCTSMFCAVTMWVTFPLVMTSSGRDFPLQMWHPFNTSNPVLYRVAYAYQIIGSYATGFVSLALDWLCLHIIYELCIQLYFLYDSFKNIDIEAEDVLQYRKSTVLNGLKGGGSNDYCDNLNAIRGELLKRNIVHHQAVIR